MALFVVIAILIAVLFAQPFYGKMRKPKTCDAYPDYIVVVSIHQLRSSSECFYKKTIVVQGYLSKPEYDGAYYDLYFDVNSLKYRDAGNKISVEFTKDQIEKYSVTLVDTKIIRVLVAAEQKYPFVISKVSEFFLQEVVGEYPVYKEGSENNETPDP